MPNPKGNPETLKSYKPQWKTGKTQTIRVPIAIASQVLEAAREIDNKSLVTVKEKPNLNGTNKLNSENKILDSDKSSQNTVTSDLIELKRIKIQLKEIGKKIESKESGYRANSFGQGIKQLKEIFSWLETH